MTINQNSYFGYWDASDEGENIYDLREDLEQDVSWVRNDNNDVVLGWVDTASNNGNAVRDGYYSVAATKANWKVDWPHDSIVQHEVTHNFGQKEDGDALIDEPGTCIMDYSDAYWGTNQWSDHSSNDIPDHWAGTESNVRAS